MTEPIPPEWFVRQRREHCACSPWAVCGLHFGELPTAERLTAARRAGVRLAPPPRRDRRAD